MVNFRKVWFMGSKQFLNNENNEEVGKFGRGTKAGYRVSTIPKKI